MVFASRIGEGSLGDGSLCHLCIDAVHLGRGIYDARIQANGAYLFYETFTCYYFKRSLITGTWTGKPGSLLLSF